MKRLVLCALIGGGIGAGAAIARSDPTAGESESSDGLKNAALSGAAGGAFVGFVLDRRAKRKRAKNDRLLGYAEKARPRVESAVEAAFTAAEFALPIIEAKASVARERAREKAIEARPKVEHAAEVARERAAEAGSAARDKAAEAGSAAREKAAEAAIHAKHVAAERADIAKRKARKSGHPKAAKALDLLPV
jgi:colicin import membrane protein